MKYKEANILILKPTVKFISFIQLNLPNLDWTSLEDLKFETTAYVVRDIQNDDDLLIELERMYLLIFNTEISKILGKKLAKKINCSFFDFLNCFKFEIHKKAALTNLITNDRQQVASIKPKSVSINVPIIAGKTNLMDICEALEQVNLASKQQIIVKGFNQVEELFDFIKRYYKFIFNFKFNICSSDIANKFNIFSDLKLLRRYLKVEMHSDSLHVN